MKTLPRAAFLGLLAMLALTVAGVILTGNWFAEQPRVTAPALASSGALKLVDEQPLVTAQRLAVLAAAPGATNDERQFSEEALRIADHELDLTFASALRNAKLHPPPLTPAARALLAHVNEIQGRVDAEQGDTARLKLLISKAEGSRKQDLEQELQLEEASLEADQEELESARQELIRAGGDTKSIIERLQEQHEALTHSESSSAPSRDAVSGNSQPPSLALSQSPPPVTVRFRAWRALGTEAKELSSAREEVTRRAADLLARHQSLQKEADAPAGNAAAQESDSSPLLSTFRIAAEEQRELAELDKRVQDLQQLDGLYANWGALVQSRQRAALHALLQSASWILAIILMVLVADPLLQRLFSRIAPGRTRLRTLHSVARFATQAAGTALILIVVFGPPSQLATVVALAGAGLTVALKDFIVGFFGWFVLMGRNGIRPGDWVEINGIAGEVLEVGLLHTVLLETGSWSDAAHPTGRKVTFVNSFAIEGHYFNFSTAGQWLWDEITVPVPLGTDPYPIAEAIQKAVTAETHANARLAEQEWQRAVPGYVERPLTAAPALTIRPTSTGMDVIVRYITRAQERYQTRSRIYHEIVELLRVKPPRPSPSEPAPSEPSTAEGAPPKTLRASG